MPLLEGEQASFTGEVLSASTFGPLQIAAPAPPVLVAALGTVMLRIAGRMASGTVTWMTGPETIESHVVPTIRDAAAEAGRPAPRIGVGLPVCVTDDVVGAREKAAEVFSIYGHLPSYRAMLDREGAAGPADVAIVGSESEVKDQIRRLAAIGTTDFCGAPFGTADRDQRRRSRRWPRWPGAESARRQTVSGASATTWLRGRRVCLNSFRSGCLSIRSRTPSMVSRASGRHLRAGSSA